MPSRREKSRPATSDSAYPSPVVFVRRMFGNSKVSNPNVLRTNCVPFGRWATKNRLAAVLFLLVFSEA
jgi:hypothetical protein